MRHLRAGKKLGRSPSHRLALYRNLAAALIQHERIVTTAAKAKAVRPFVEKIITLARKGTLHARRLAISRLGPASQTPVRPGDGADADPRTVIQKLFEDLGPRFADRPGGYTRIIKRTYRRLGDGGETAYLELLREGEQKVRARQPYQAPAPQVEEEGQQEVPAPAEQEQPAPTPEGQGEAAPEQPQGEGGQPPQA